MTTNEKVARRKLSLLGLPKSSAISAAPDSYKKMAKETIPAFVNMNTSKSTQMNTINSLIVLFHL